MDNEFRHVRLVEDDTDQLLLDAGWEFAGLSLFWHANIHSQYFTKVEALKMNYPSLTKISEDYAALADSYEELWDLAANMFDHLDSYVKIGNELNVSFDDEVKIFLDTIRTTKGKFNLPAERLKELSELSAEFLKNATEEQLGSFSE